MNTTLERKHTILISDSSEIFLTGLAKIIRNISNQYSILHARNNSEIESIIQHSEVDLVIFEINLVSGTFIKKLHDDFPKIKMIGFGDISNCNIIKVFIDLGLNSYLFKNDPKKEFIKAIQLVLNNQLYFGQQVQHIINTKLFTEHGENDNELIASLMNERFREILYLIYYELTIKEIAGKLGIAIKTVEGYRTKMLRLVGANNMVGLALFAERHQIHHERDLHTKFKLKKREYLET